ncbi:MAG: hypothetical protein ACLR7U_04095 [Ruthenibacterium lactatiformans]
MAELTKKCKRLWTKPGIRWLCGYFFVLLCGVGLVYYWRVAYSLGAGMPGFAAATTLIICGGFSAVYLLVFLAAHFLKQNLALKTACWFFWPGSVRVYQPAHAGSGRDDAFPAGLCRGQRTVPVR